MLARPLARLLLLAVFVAGSLVPLAAPRPTVAAEASSDLFAELRTFAGTVLVPPDGLDPFAAMSPYRVEIGRDNLDSALALAGLGGRLEPLR